jgi:toxin YoeB
MRSIVFEGDTWERYGDLRRGAPSLHRALCRQLNEMQRGDPSSGTGKPEPLKHALSGLWSRRLSLKDRIIYRFCANAIYVMAIGGQPWMLYAGMVESGDSTSSRGIDEIVYGQETSRVAGTPLRD